MKKIFLATTMILFASKSFGIEYENITDVTENIIIKAISPPVIATIELNSPEFGVGNSQAFELGKVVMSTQGYYGIYKSFRWAKTNNQVPSGHDVIVFEKNDSNKYLAMQFAMPYNHGYQIVTVDNTGGLSDDEWYTLGSVNGNDITYNTDPVQKAPFYLTTATEIYHAGTYPVTIEVATFKL